MPFCVLIYTSYKPLKMAQFVSSPCKLDIIGIVPADCQCEVCYIFNVNFAKCPNI